MNNSLLGKRVMISGEYAGAGNWGLGQQVRPVRQGIVATEATILFISWQFYRVFFGPFRLKQVVLGSPSLATNSFLIVLLSLSQYCLNECDDGFRCRRRLNAQCRISEDGKLLHLFGLVGEADKLLGGWKWNICASYLRLEARPILQMSTRMRWEWGGLVACYRIYALQWPLEPPCPLEMRHHYYYD